LLNNDIWPEKYFPKEISDIVGNPTAVKKIYDFVKNWKKQKIKALLLTGRPGVGKTSTVYVVARILDHEVVEVNASDVRNKDNILRIIGRSSLDNTLFSKGRILLLDEVDGLAGNQDRGGVSAIKTVLKSTKFPIIMTCNDLYDKKIASLRNDKLVTVVKFRPIKKDSVIKVLTNICKKEGIEAEYEAIMKIAENSGGDLRSAIMDLQSLADGKNALTYEDVISVNQSRNREEMLFNALKQMFLERDPQKIRNVISNTDVDWNLLLQWVNEQIPHHMKEMKELVDAYQFLARADIFYGRIQNRMESEVWSLLPYVIEDMSIGVSLSRTETPFRNVQYFRNNPNFYFANLGKFRRGPLVNACYKIREKTGKSIERVISEDLPFLSIILKNDKKKGEEIINAFGFDKPDIKAIINFEKIFN